MTRWLFILLAVVAGWFSPANAHALTRAGQAAYDGGAALEKVVFVAGITMDTHEGYQTEPLSLHKYLYTKADPVNRIDPNGHDDIGSVLATMSTLGSVNTVSVAISPIKAVLGTCGPDVTQAVLNTCTDVEQTFLHASKQTQQIAAANILSPAIGAGWDTAKLVDLGFQGAPNFGNGSVLGTGPGALTVQFTYGGNQRVYLASCVNYFLWGRMVFLSNYILDNPYPGFYSESAAVAAARFHKAVINGDVFNSYATEAAAFVRFGYSATDPSSTALPLKPNPSNIAAPTRFKWQWIGLHDTEQ